MLKSMLERVREAHAAEFEGEEAAEAGFTLIELMVVLLIIAILLAIAIPTFLGVTGSANDRAAQSNLTNAMTEATALYQNNNQTFTGPNPLTAASYSASAPEFKWTAGPCTAAAGANCVSFQAVDVAQAGDGAGLILADLSKTGMCWYVVNLNAAPASPKVQFSSGNANAVTGGTFYASQKAPAAGCDATAAGVISGLKWGTSYSDNAGQN